LRRIRSCALMFVVDAYTNVDAAQTAPFLASVDVVHGRLFEYTDVGPWRGVSTRVPYKRTALLAGRASGLAVGVRRRAIRPVPRNRRSLTVQVVTLKQVGVAEVTESRGEGIQLLTRFPSFVDKLRHLLRFGCFFLLVGFFLGSFFSWGLSSWGSQIPQLLPCPGGRGLSRRP